MPAAAGAREICPCAYIARSRVCQILTGTSSSLSHHQGGAVVLERDGIVGRPRVRLERLQLDAVPTDRRLFDRLTWRWVGVELHRRRTAAFGLNGNGDPRLAGPEAFHLRGTP